MVAMALTGLLGFSALVVDIGMLWNAQQNQRALADSAALAGVQEMQVAGTRGLTTATRENGRGAAMANVVDQIGASGMPTCAVGGAPSWDPLTSKYSYAADVRDCPLSSTDYLVSILTPSPLCVDCTDSTRNIMVEVTRLNVPTFFASLFGVDGWTSRQTSVASIGYRADFAVMTLRPPHPSYDVTCVVVNCDLHEDNIEVSGTARLRVSVGDLGTNTNMVFTGGATAGIDDGYMVHHYDRYQAWGTFPAGKRLFSMIEDPSYPMPTRTGAPTFATQAAGKMTDLECAAEQAKVPVEYTRAGTPIRDVPVSEVQCLKPGIYTSMINAPNAGPIVLFTPGVFFLDGGLDIKGIAVGGYDEGPPAATVGNPGATLVFPYTTTVKSRNAALFAVNAGGNFGGGTGPEAAPAIGFDGVPVSTGTGPAGNDPNLLISLMVTKDPTCPVVEPYPTGCGERNTLDLNGGSTLHLAGVQYAPSDNILIGGASGGQGRAGRIVAWTVLYHGNADVTQAYPGADQGNGVLRLDQACAGSGSTGMSNAACNP